MAIGIARCYTGFGILLEQMNSLATWQVAIHFVNAFSPSALEKEDEWWAVWTPQAAGICTVWTRARSALILSALTWPTGIWL